MDERAHRGVSELAAILRKTNQESLLLAGLDNAEIQDVLRDELDLLMVDEFRKRVRSSWLCS